MVWLIRIYALLVFVAGLLTLRQEKIGKFEFGCCWAMLMTHLMILSIAAR